MQSLLLRVGSTPLVVSQINLKVINTFFALTLGIYYVSVHHSSKVFQWRFPHQLYEIKSDETKKPEVFLASANLHFPYVIHSPFFVHNLSPLLSAGGVQFSVPSVNIYSRETFVIKDYSEKYDMLIRFSTKNEENFYNEFHNVATNYITQLDKILEPPPPQKPPFMLGSAYTTKLIEDEPAQEIMSRSSISQHPLRVSKKTRTRSFLGANMQWALPTANTARNTTSGNIKELLPAWNTLIEPHSSQLLRLWLMILAPGSNVPTDEIPFREALIKTLLSPDFQPYINLDWETENDSDMRKMRKNFGERYLESIEWSKTPYKKLFTTSRRDFFHTNHDAYVDAYDFPLKKLGIRVYRDEDFGCDEVYPGSKME